MAKVQKNQNSNWGTLAKVWDNTCGENTVKYLGKYGQGMGKHYLIEANMIKVGENTIKLGKNGTGVGK